MKQICVLGSLNIDMTLFVPHFNAPGETVTGTSLQIFTGGKGGNQAVACARLGAPVKMIGCLGSDANGAMYREALRREGVDASGVETCADVPSGAAFIEVTPEGENRIALAAGANGRLTPERVRSRESEIAACGLYLTQLENPLEAIAEGLRIAHAHGLTAILDPAPARPLPDELLALCDIVTPNETELRILTGMPSDTLEEAAAAARSLIERGARLVLNKRGAAGALLVSAGECRVFPGFPVNAVDTTAAGDSFNAGLAVGLAEGLGLEEAIRLANATGALSTTQAGAQPAMPTRAQAEALIHCHTLRHTTQSSASRVQPACSSAPSSPSGDSFSSNRSLSGKTQPRR